MRKDSQRGVETVRRGWLVVQAVGNGVELVLGEHAQIGALGQVLAQQSVGVLAGATLPGAVPIAEVDLHARGSAQFLVPAHLLALVVSEAATHGFGNRIQFGRKARQRRCRRGVLHLGQQHQTAGALH